MMITLSMLVHRWFHEKRYPLWRIEEMNDTDYHSDFAPGYSNPDLNIRIVRLRRPLNAEGTALEKTLPRISINEAEGSVILHDSTKISAADPEFFTKLEKYVQDIDERDDLARWQKLYAGSK